MEQEDKQDRAEAAAEPEKRPAEEAGAKEAPKAAEEPAGEPEASAPEEDLAAQVADLKKKLDEADARFEKQKDLLLRTAAEYDNFRKRTAREKTAVYADATAAAVLEVLPVADSLARALEQRECGADDMRKGVELVNRQMLTALSRLGVEEMGTEGEPFDPALHNAVSHVEEEGRGENVVAKVFQKGYRIGDRVIRHAMVQVAN